MSKKKILLVCGILLLGAGIWWLYPKGKKIQYREAKVERQNIQISILTTGKVYPENRVEIKPPVAGRIEEVLVREGQEVKKGSVLAWMSSSERAALIDSARARGPEELKEWEEIYKPTPILAPISGMIILRSVESGQSFTTSEAVLVMSDHLVVQATLDETDLASVKPGQKVEIRLDAYPDDAISGKVLRIAYESTTTNNVTTYTAYVLPEDPPEFMRSGMTANVSVYVNSKENVVAVPNSMLRNTPQGVEVKVKTTEGIKNALLTLGITDGKFSEVIEGVKEGDVVVEELAAQAEEVGSSPFGPRPRGRRR